MTGLPTPVPDLIEQSQRLQRRIIDQIRSRGPLGLDDFMQLALYEPGLGYYSAGQVRFGEQGDFITAPEVSVVFAHCLANQCQQIMQQAKPDMIIECGAGSGRLAHDLLLQLQAIGSVPGQYWILETSPALRHRQQQLLQQLEPALYERITWFNEPAQAPVSAIVIANEVLDALPFKRVRIDAGSMAELKVNFADDRFCWQAAEPPTEVEASEQHCLDGLVAAGCSDYATEIHNHQSAWLTAVSRMLNSGIILLVDYGYSAAEYYSPERSIGTLLCHYRNHVHDDVFFYPGLQDITCSVNFTAVRDQLVRNGWTSLGYTTQSCFLIGCDLESVCQRLFDQADSDPITLNQQIRRLTMPEQMGERFHVFAAGKNLDMALQGFGFRDMQHQL